MVLENKYNLTIEQNIFLAKRNIVDNIYANARMEGVNFWNEKPTFLVKQFIFEKCIDGIEF